ncbi:unnamed protein product [Owenia fusiformis]|uniref:Uncharacterized protein n=1 Tax=Owenia fusiformis TaxID=6347 RepID=A0A8S4NB65_OWEFU|nr:unnamed protein product [Owenia fusiformis]
MTKVLRYTCLAAIFLVDAVLAANVYGGEDTSSGTLAQFLREILDTEKRGTSGRRDVKCTWMSPNDDKEFLLKTDADKHSISFKEKEHFVNYHNEHRAKTRPSAANMNYIIWDPELAELAQVWADKCVYKHGQPGETLAKQGRDPNEFIGQNMQAWSWSFDEERSMYSWWEEINYYNYYTQKCEGKQCGHYTQFAWAGTDRMGCGISYCERLKNAYPDYEIHWYYVVCNYLPGHWQNKKIFKEGPKCSQCPPDKSQCDNGLCRSPQKCPSNYVCQNGGTLLPNTGCICHCPKEYTGDSCETPTGVVFQCDFEEDDCGFSNDLKADFTWTKNAGGTPDGQTGPAGDHTTGGRDTGYYMYTDGSKKKPGQKARLISPTFDVSSGSSVEFYWHMCGPGIGSLNVYSQKDGRESLLWSINGEQSFHWNRTAVPLNPGRQSIVFEGELGPKQWSSDMAIDDIAIKGKVTKQLLKPNLPTPPNGGGGDFINIPIDSGKVKDPIAVGKPVKVPLSSISWSIHPDKLLSGKNDREITGVTREECMDECRKDVSCKSLDYSGFICILSKSTAKDAQLKSVSGWVYIEKGADESVAEESSNIDDDSMTLTSTGSYSERKGYLLPGHNSKELRAFVRLPSFATAMSAPSTPSTRRKYKYEDGKLLPGHNTKELRGVATKEKCTELCDSRPECKSVDYSSRLELCIISTSTAGRDFSLINVAGWIYMEKLEEPNSDGGKPPNPEAGTSPVQQFTKHAGKYMAGENDHVRSGKTVEQCLQDCLNWADCKAVDYQNSGNVCIQTATPRSKATIRSDSSRDWDFYERTGGSPSDSSVKADVDKDTNTETDTDTPSSGNGVSDFTTEKGKYLPGNNKDELKGLTEKECIEKCAQKKWCMSADYMAKRQVCILSESSRKMGVSLISSADWTFHERQDKKREVLKRLLDLLENRSE